MALSYLPAEHIPAVFECLETKATTPMLIQLVTYIHFNRIEDDLWSPDKWSVFGQAVWANNDVQRWHGHAKISFHLLVHLLCEQGFTTAAFAQMCTPCVSQQTKYCRRLFV